MDSDFRYICPVCATMSTGQGICFGKVHRTPEHADTMMRLATAAEREDGNRRAREHQRALALYHAGASWPEALAAAKEEGARSSQREQSDEVPRPPYG